MVESAGLTGAAGNVPLGAKIRMPATTMANASAFRTARAESVEMMGAAAPAGPALQMKAAWMADASAFLTARGWSAGQTPTAARAAGPVAQTSDATTTANASAFRSLAKI